MAEYTFNEAFQQRLLAAVVRRPDKMQGLVEPEYFTSPVFQDIAKLAAGVRNDKDTKNAVLSKTTLLMLLRDYLGGSRKDLWPMYKRATKRLYKTSLSDLPVLGKEAAEFIKHAKFKEALILAEKDVNNNKYESAMARMSSLKSVGHENDLGLDYWKDFKAADRWREDRKNLIRTFYFPKLDESMGGGAGAGELVIVEGGAKSGKSTLLGRVSAGFMWQGKKVAVASGELSAKKYRKRIDAMLSGISYFDLYNKRSLPTGTRAQLEAVRAACSGEMRIKSFPANRSRIMDIERWLDRLAEDQGFVADVLVVDYLTLFKSNEKYEDKRVSIGESAVDLRGLAMEKEIPVWTAAQVNRAGLDKPMIGPSDLAEDISLFFTLDFLIAICQTKDERGTEEDRRNGKPEKARLMLAAARDTASGAIVQVSLKRDKFIIKEEGYWTGPKDDTSNEDKLERPDAKRRKRSKKSV